MKTPGSTGKKPSRKSGPPPLPKFMQSNIPTRDEAPFNGEDDLAVIEKLRGRSVEELRGLLASLKGKHRPGLQMMIVKEILTAQRKARKAPLR
jgi:hypothetical protein